MANEAHATKQGPGGEEDGLHRLRDIVVEEVSLVDRAANKRRFLVVKRSGDMPDDGELGAEVKPDGRRGLTAEVRVEKAKKKPKAEAEDGETEKARRRPVADDGEDETEKARRKDDDEDVEKARRRASAEDEEEDAEKARGDEDDEEEEGEDDEDCEDTEKARSRSKPTVGGRPEANEEFDEGIAEKANAGKLVVPKPVKEAVLRAVTEALERLMSVAKRVKEASETGDKVKAPLPGAVAREIDAIAELIEGIGKSFPSPASKAAVAKAGARMAKDRLDRFQKALALLSEVLKELTDAKKPCDPTAGAAEDKVAKRDAEAVPGMGQLVASIGELTRVVKRQEDELARIRQARGVSNAIPVDGGGRRAEPQEVSWPLDMNRPISRDSVAKAVSFFDE